MSYCRFSTNDFQCDVYAYDGHGGIVVHVAATRVVFAESLPARIPFELAHLDAWIERDRKVSAMVEAGGREAIKRKHAGESYYGLDADDAVALMEELKALGYRFPMGIIEAMREEIEDGDV